MHKVNHKEPKKNLEEEAYVKAALSIDGPKIEVFGFDEAFYKLTNQEVDFDLISPLAHFLNSGWRNGRDPSASFSVSLYLERNGDVRESGINPLVHYNLWGHLEKRPIYPSQIQIEAGSAFKSPDLSRDPEFLAGEKAEEEEDVIEFEVAPAIRGALKSHFDKRFYRETYPDVAMKVRDLLGHYICYGWKEGRNPSRRFSTDYYIRTNPDISKAEINPLLHYVLYGRFENRRPLPTLQEQFSLALDPHDVRETLALPVANIGRQAALRDSEITVGIHIHCYYRDLIKPLLTWAARVPARRRVFISVPNKQMAFEVKGYAKDFGLEVERIAVTPNRGRDIAPMIVEFRSELQSCDLALHIHTKKSVEKLSEGAIWFKELERNLAFNRAYCKNILNVFEQDEKCGAIVPVPLENVRPFMVWGNNRTLAASVLDIFGLNKSILEMDRIEFPAGSMFWFRPQALKAIFDAGITFNDFPKEPIADDGTLAHVIERCFTYVTENAGYSTIRVKPLPYHYCWPSFVPRRLSIIIPVYNAEKWLSNCLSSVIMQNAAHVPTEIIVVDNNSTDNSMAILQRFARLYQNVKVLEQQVQGAGAARNMGLEVATGEFVMFLDADDVLTVDAVSQLFAAADVLGGVDCVMSSLVMFDEYQASQAIPYGNSGQYWMLDRGLDHLSTKRWETVFSDFGPCAKIYRKDFLVRNNIKFPEQGNFEDNSFVYDVYLTADRIGILSHLSYLYRKYRIDSGSTQSTSLNISSLRDQFNVMSGIVDKYGLNAPNKPIYRVALQAIANKIASEIKRYESNKFLGNVMDEYAGFIFLLEKSGVKI
ncbi:rhamnan synthesis F family protein [Nitrospirillum pindoramense]|uniref:Glycosyl transferase family 2 n=1 Tax=Nitrospirillum amazonense TaxID=28077 RepID=A0A560H6J8_9PROT|nr:rhamnan synthesis F family protein [Nitrospirillum amazonense]TWB41180.1 glycosyl transferase family 2 [Nitrospirillum amazonense]